MRTRTGKASPKGKACCDDCEKKGTRCCDEPPVPVRTVCSPCRYPYTCYNPCCFPVRCDPCRPLSCNPCRPLICDPCRPLICDPCRPVYCDPCLPVCRPCAPCLPSSTEYDLVKGLFDIIREERDLE